MKGITEKNDIKKKIGVGSVVEENLGDMEENTRGRRIRRTRKYVVVYFKDVVGKQKLLVQLEDGQKIYMSDLFLYYLCSEEEFFQEVDETISEIYKKGQGELLFIYWYSVSEGYGMFEKYVVVYILWFIFC